MGIPAFYKHLLQTVAGLTSKTRSRVPDLLALDLNCAIYHCVRLQQKETPYKPATKAAYEQAVVDRTIAYIQQLDRYVTPHALYIAVDGVAPMAKLKQQRMRRFKSAVTAEEEARVKAAAEGKRYVKEERWDTNAITPGTDFMERLTRSLYAFQERNKDRVTVSPADEPGEGEQKIMDYLRGKPDITDTVVYGLDADLIILSLYHQANHDSRVDLFREETEFMGGGVKVDALGEEQFLYLSTTVLADVLFANYAKEGQQQAAFISDFVGLMNLQGNDFVPHGMGLKIKDEGIERVLEIQRASPTALISVDAKTKVATYNVDALKRILGILAEEEPHHVLTQCRKKLTQRGGYGKTEQERAMARYQDQPLEWRAEDVLVIQSRVEGMEKTQYALRPDWCVRYDREVFEGGAAAAAVAYCESLAWTMAYYSGAPAIDTEWYYPWLLPPRFSTVCDFLTSAKTLPIPTTVRPLLTPKEQLALVLPESSFHLLPSEYRRLCDRHAWAFPVKWPVFSLGRRYLWECEPIIPLVTPSQMRGWIEEIYEP